MLYLAGPYNHPDPHVMELRFEILTEIAAKYINAGTVVYSPITHNHPIAVRHGLPRGWEFWEHFDRTMLSKCNLLGVVKLDGWDKSEGVKAEMAIARELRIPIVFLTP